MVKKIRKSQKISKKSFFFCWKKATPFDQSSPVQPVSESRGGSPKRNGGGRTNEGNPCV